MSHLKYFESYLTYKVHSDTDEKQLSWEAYVKRYLEIKTSGETGIKLYKTVAITILLQRNMGSDKEDEIHILSAMVQLQRSTTVCS